MKRIFILASERSGTNLLRTLLNNHNSITGPPPIHLFNIFRPIISKYGNLNLKRNKRKLITHAYKIVNDQFSSWNLTISEDEFLNKYSINSLPGLFDSLYQEYAFEKGKQHYVSKDNDLYNHIDLISQLPNRDEHYFIYLYRDPRDVVNSWLKTPIFLFSSYTIAGKWLKEQKIIDQVSSNLNIFKLSYESLIKNPQKKMTELLEFINVDIDANCFSPSSQNKEAKRIELWKNINKPIIKDNDKKFSKELSRLDISVTEALCEDYMEKLDYKKTHATFINKLLLRYYLHFIHKKKINQNKEVAKKNLNKDLKLLKNRKKIIMNIKEEMQ